MLQRIALVPERHPRWLAIGCGLLAACGFPPLHLWPLALVGVAGLVWLVWQSTGWREAFLRGWLFGVAHFTFTNNWIATAFTYQAEMPALLGWAAVPLLSLYLAVFPAAAAALARGMRSDARLLPFGLALGAAWIAAEWVRSWLFTGYAWGPLSLMLLGPFDRPGAARLLPLAGTYALSGLAVVLASLLLWAALRRRWLPLAGLAALITAAMYWPAGAPEEGTLRFTLVQPDLRQEVLNDPTKFEEQFLTIARLSLPRRDANGPRLVLWPESAVPDYLEPGYPQRYYDQMTAGGDPGFARTRIGRVIGEDSLLLTGVVHLEIEEVAGYERATGARNSVSAIYPDGALGPSYSKAHLVPYGEYLPMRALLEPLGFSRLVAGTLDFIPGPGPETLDLGPWGRAGMQICYEIVFSGEVADRENRPDYIFNPSNDGWFGAFGPPQHLAQARMRAIEEGLPVLRATTTGISAVIDARGVVRSHIAMRRADRIDGLVPPAAPPTWFARLGHWLTLVWGIALIAASLVARRLAKS
ncbi:apolipoprotein N-acyltransferase [Qipengyuania sp. MTN3-11]|uniref:apolipoprotein N-acyltransferase n=1 Tax=Qipengyuania sp. MTN3-11 TaxID=3056557 RepID=UPI0036F4489C